MRFRISNHFVETLLHHTLQPLIHFMLSPKKSLAILNPFEIADRDSSRIGEDVRYDENTFIFNACVGVSRRRAVCALAQDTAVDAIRIFSRDLVFRGGRNQEVAMKKQDFL